MTDCRDYEPRWYPWVAVGLAGLAALIALGIVGTALLWGCALLTG